MPSISLGDVSAFGVIRDIPPHELPILAWSDVKNMRFGKGSVERVQGERTVMGTPSIAPYYVFPYDDRTNLSWLYPGLTKVYAWQGGTHTNLTRQSAGVDVDYAATVDRNWTHTILGGVPILNNGIDPPQMWLPPTLGQRLQALSNWPTGYTCGAMRAFKQYLVAMDVTKSSTRYPYMVKWSHPAAPGTVPVSWDESDTTKDAGEVSLSDTLDFVVDSLPLRQANVIYKTATTHLMTFVGGTQIFRFDKLFETFGAVSRRCAAEFFGKHLVFSLNDTVVHDGVQADSILTDKWRKWISANVDITYYPRSFVVHIQRLDEVWMCFPTTGNTLPNRAVIWNYRRNTLTDREISHLSHIHFGALDPNSLPSSWDSDSDPWSSDTTDWDASTYNIALREIAAARPLSTQLVQVESGVDTFGTAYEAYVERQGIGIPLRPGDPPDVSSRKFVNRIWPRITGDSGQTVLVKVGMQKEIDSPIVWRPTQSYVLGSNRPIGVETSGRLLALRFESSGAFSWQLRGVEVDVQPAGGF